jgi:hypothetical protein
MAELQNKKQQQAGSERPDLDARYGRIGISAVAAAARYQHEYRNPAYAPVVPRPIERPDEVAA